MTEQPKLTTSRRRGAPLLPYHPINPVAEGQGPAKSSWLRFHRPRLLAGGEVVTDRSCQALGKTKVCHRGGREVGGGGGAGRSTQQPLPPPPQPCERRLSR